MRAIQLGWSIASPRARILGDSILYIPQFLSELYDALTYAGGCYLATKPSIVHEKHEAESFSCYGLTLSPSIVALAALDTHPHSAMSPCWASHLKRKTAPPMKLRPFACESIFEKAKESLFQALSVLNKAKDTLLNDKKADDAYFQVTWRVEA